MGKHAQLVIGPAGTGKSTYCKTMQTHCETVKRSVHVLNLDPAAENTKYPSSIDIRDLITLEDVMEEFNYGPNGGLIYCMEYLLENVDWLKDELGDFDDDYLIIDCPGQIELYLHLPVMKEIAQVLQDIGYSVCSCYLIDSHYITDSSKFISAILLSLSSMVQLELPHVNILTKMDLFSRTKTIKKSFLEKYLDPDMEHLIGEMHKDTGAQFYKLNQAFRNVIEEWNMVSFLPCDISDSDSLNFLLANIDNAIQYGEDLEPREPKEFDVEIDGDEDDEGYGGGHGDDDHGW
eukprot:TRINITY_DN285_c0_g1_i1.p1 TRINITY_DN285_c0_g1~~TRINITY_DN285_c0_g1_i1.p1  ORF type:complete len:291 (-),score=74.53 TRINITY_DN285_c0_g1_i1:231-1103(-)